MKQTSKANSGIAPVKTAYERVRVQPAAAIGETDLDKVSGGGGSPGGVLGDRSRA